MDEQYLVRSLLLRIGRGVPASASLAKALVDWAAPHLRWLGLTERKKLPWADLIATAEVEGTGNRDGLFELLDALADLLALEGFDRALLVWMVAGDRLTRVGTLLKLAVKHGFDLAGLLGELAGAEPTEAARLVRRSALLRLGLVGLCTNRQDLTEIEVRWTLARLLDRAPSSAADLLDALVGPREAAGLPLDAFAHVEDRDFLVRLLAGALATRAPGINLLIHGPPGTGKTELARALAAGAGAVLHAVGEVDDEGQEPNRWDRVDALQVAQRLLSRGGGAVILFDEMEDLIGDAAPSTGDFMKGREGSKIFVNRLLETNPVPVVWTTNAVDNVDPAILRRMSFVLRLPLPSPGVARQMLARIAAAEDVTPDPGVTRLLDRAPEAASVLRVAARSARLAGDGDGGLRAAGALVRALRGSALPPGIDAELDLDLFESDVPLGPLFDRLAKSGVDDVSMLLTGPPGTGKTALAHHLARALDRPLVTKRASDLLSPWVGGTEAAVAKAFAEAREHGNVLLFDEVDSLLFDRTTARHSWEVGQVNEMLTWLDYHPLPVIAATNHAHRLDPAALRRFAFKLDLGPLGAERAALAFARFFGEPAPPALADLRGLTPGDFAVVARQQRLAGAVGPERLVEMLAREVAVKPAEAGRIGFG